MKIILYDSEQHLLGVISVDPRVLLLFFGTAFIYSDNWGITETITYLSLFLELCTRPTRKKMGQQPYDTSMYKKQPGELILESGMQSKKL